MGNYWCDWGVRVLGEITCVVQRSLTKKYKTMINDAKKMKTERKNFCQASMIVQWASAK